MLKKLISWRKKEKSDNNPKKNRKIFGTPIEPTKEYIPEAIEQIITWLEENAIAEYDLFRFCNSPDVVDLKRQIDNGDLPLKLNKESIHSITGVLILFFRELPEPLLTFGLYDDFVQSIEYEGQERLKRTASLLARIPLGNYSFLNFVLLFFWKVKEFSITNGVTSANLGVLFGPYILNSAQDFSSQTYSNVSNDVVTWLIDYYPLVFDVTALYLPNSIRTKKKLEQLKHIKTDKKGSQSIASRSSKGRGTLKLQNMIKADSLSHEGAASLFENVQEELYLSVVQPKKVSFPTPDSSRGRKMTLPSTQAPVRPAHLLPMVSAIELPRVRKEFDSIANLPTQTTQTQSSYPRLQTESLSMSPQASTVSMMNSNGSPVSQSEEHKATDRETLMRLQSDLDEMEGLLNEI